MLFGGSNGKTDFAREQRLATISDIAADYAMGGGNAYSPLTERLRAIVQIGRSA
jgi:hypothetical protein